MRVVSPLLEHVSTGVAKRLDYLVHPVPEHARAAIRAAGPLPGLDRDPVFFISGLTADRWMYRRGAQMTRDEGFVTGGLRMPWHGWGGIPNDAAQVREGVERLVEKAQKRGHDVDKVQLLGDSEGGLIGRYFLQFEGGNDLVSRFVSNGTPHQGIKALGNDRINRALQHLTLMPDGVKDLLTSSPVMRDLNGDLGAFQARARAADPDFEMHSIASRISAGDDTVVTRILGHETDGLVPISAAYLPGDPAYVHNYLTQGVHSINLAFGKRDAEAGHILLHTLGSQEPAAAAAAAHGEAAHATWRGTREITAAH